jgi:hypothetical protein
MGFFKSLGRIVSGKGAYEPGDFKSSGQQAPTQPTGQFPDGQPNGFPQDFPGQAPQAPGAPQPVQQQGPKVIPVVRIHRVESQVNGQRLDVYGDIKNESPVPVVLDKIIIQGMRRELDRALRPGESHQCLVYSGAPLRSLPNGYADVQFRTENSDYFSARHQIRVQQLPDRTYKITEFLLTMPINDMH